MKRILFSIVLFYLLLFESAAQQPQDRLNQWAVKNPIEKVYLHLDRDGYAAGQTIWLKAYLTSDFLPADKSTVLFVELINSSSFAISRLSLPVVRGVSQGQFELPDTLTSGRYIIRAFTATMLNMDADFIFKRSIHIAGLEKKKAAASTASSTRLEFFPEGGNFVAGHPNTIAFKATDTDGWPVNIKGVVKNNKQEILTEFSSLHDGMGMIDLNAELNAGYYVELKDDPAGQKYLLPEISEKGIVFRLLNASNGIHFEIFQKKNDPVFEAAYMIGQIQHHSVFRQTFKKGGKSLAGRINTSQLPSGILHITVFNKDGMPLAERLSFVNNKEYIKEAQLSIDTLDLSARGKNHFSLTFKDSVTGSFSVSISDLAYSSQTTREENIFSSLLLTSDLKGYVHNPAWYFSADNDSTKYALDLLMMTNGWRRFKWQQLLNDSLPAGPYKDPAFVTLSGQVNFLGTKKPYADKDLIMYVVAEDSTSKMHLIKTDANGHYNIDSLVFFGSAKVLFSDAKEKKRNLISVYPAADSLNRSFLLTRLKDEELLLQNMFSKSNENITKKLTEEYRTLLKANGTTLSEVVLKSTKKTPLEELNEKYTSGHFSSVALQTIDLVNSDDAVTYHDIFDYLRSRVPGLKIILPDYESSPKPLLNFEEPGASYKIFFRQNQNPSVSDLGQIPMTLYLNEVETGSNVIAAIPANSIALIKVFSSVVGTTGGGAGGALAIYTKKIDDLTNSIPRSDLISTHGFSVIKEFYSPDYAVPQKKHTSPDQRITLYWKPDVFVNGKNIKLPVVFYNNDRTKTFKVVVEGMTIDGKMLMMEKIISAKPF
jgi:hypothetical protein